MAQVTTGVVPDTTRWGVVAVGRARAWWAALPERKRTGVKVVALLAVVVIAYNYSLSTLWQLAGLNTPLAYVSLAPAIALALAAIRSRPLKPEPQIHDRQTDYIVGVPLMAGALAVNLYMPGRLSAMFWVWRIDLLTLPFFVAGAAAVIFGVRVMWRQRLAICFLFLAWPYLYEAQSIKVLDAFTSATLWSVTTALKFLPLAKPVNSLDNTLFIISHHGSKFPISVVSACSGVNSVVGFLLVGSAFGAIVRGPLARKLGWLFGGMAMLWVINIGRILFIFWAGKVWGQDFALNVLHPVIGLITFSLGVIVMLSLLRPMGLHIEIGEPGPNAALASPAAAVPQGGSSTAEVGAGAGAGAGAEVAPPRPPRRGEAVPRIYSAMAVVLVLAVVLGVSNFGLRDYNLVADVAGQARVISYFDHPVAPKGWLPRHTETISWTKPMFGDDSTWNRYTLYPRVGGDLHAQADVVADVIETPDLESYSAFGVVQCYQFHGYSLADLSSVQLPGGITGQAMAYDSRQYGTWTVVYWILPVKAGNATYYERVVLYVQNQHGLIAPATQSAQAGIQNLAGSLNGGGQTNTILLQNRAFLVAFAREFIQTQAHVDAIAANGHPAAV